MSDNPLFKDDADKIGWLDIGGGHFIKFCEYEGDARSAIRDKHLTKDGQPCQGFIAFEGHTWANVFNANKPDGTPSEAKIPAWKVESLDPLTISPSVLCRTCGDHGFIQQGKWVAA